jgi:hypothetical protein
MVIVEPVVLLISEVLAEVLPQRAFVQEPVRFR